MKSLNDRLLALQISEWNQGRIDQNLEQAYLARLAAETVANLEMLKSHERIFENKVQFILALPNLSLYDAFERDPREFMLQLDNSPYVQIPDMRSETYQELESSGRLALIRDVHLRSAIASNLSDYRSTRTVFMEPIGGYRRLLYETLPGRSYFDYRVEDNTTGTATIVAAVEAFRSDPRFDAAANAEVSYGSDVLAYIREFIKRSEEILSLLQAKE